MLVSYQACSKVNVQKILGYRNFRSLTLCSRRYSLERILGSMLETISEFNNFPLEKCIPYHQKR